MKKIYLFFALMMLTVLGATTAFAAKKEIYAALSSDSKTMTLYYDTQKSTRSGVIADWSEEVGMYYVPTETKKAITAAELDASMKDALPKSTAFWFYKLVNMQTIQELNYLNTTDVTSMKHMFRDCQSLTSLDLSHFETSNVADMSYMFGGCPYINAINLTGFNTSKVTDMSYMFSGCLYLKEINVDNFDVSKADINYMFQGCANLKTIYCSHDWSKNIGTGMFSQCYKLKGGNGTTWSDDKRMDAYLARPDGLNGKSGYFTLPKKVYTSYDESTHVLTYYYDSKYDSRPIVEFYEPGKTTATRWVNYHDQVEKVNINASMLNAPLTSMYNMFYGYFSGASLYNLSNLTEISGMENLNTQNVTDMSFMFGGCWKLNILDLSMLNTSNVTSMKSMFGGCGELKKLDLSSFDVSKVTIMSDMFKSCSKLATIYCNQDWTSGVVTSSSGMFDDCKKLQGGKGTQWIATNPKDITYARPDEGSDSDKPGYFTLLPVSPEQIAAAKEELLLWMQAASTVGIVLQAAGETAAVKEVRKVIDSAQAIYDKTDATMGEINVAISALRAAVTPYSEEVLSAFQMMGVGELEDLLEEDDSDACKKIIDDAKDAMNKLAWDDEKSFMENLQAITNGMGDIIDQAEKALDAERNGTTAIDQIDSSSLQGGDRGRLILRDGQLFILRGEKTYTLTGQEVR